MVRYSILLSGVFATSLALTQTGCQNGTEIPAPITDKAGKKTDSEHAHKPSAHGGIIVQIGSDSYHAEAVFEKKGVLRFYTLGADESKVMEVEAEPAQAFFKVEGETEQQSFLLRPEPQAGDSKGMTSLFVGNLPRETWGKRVTVTIPNFRIGKERFRIPPFSNVQDEHGNPMVRGVATREEKKLYLEPGGAYTAADIQANGNTTASEKFKGFRAEHDMHPKKGDKICPITETKANPKVTWVVGGKTYEFCCPPCVDEFVARAKENPASIKAPETYVQK